MANPVLHWKRLPRQLVATTTSSTMPLPSTLDAVWTMINSSTYYDGEARTLGVGSAVQNIARDQPLGVTEAIYGQFATITAKGAKWIVAARAVVPGTIPPRTDVPVTWTVSMLGAITLDGGAFTTWNNATAPFSGCAWAGYSGSLSLTPGGTGHWWVDGYECEEGLWIGISTSNAISTGLLVSSVFLGGLIEPDPDFAETDGRIYVQGSGIVGSTFLTAPSGDFLFNNTASPSTGTAPHFYCLVPGNTANYFRWGLGQGLNAAAAGTVVRTDVDGVRVGVPIPVVVASGTPSSAAIVGAKFNTGKTGAFVGTLRGIVMTADVASGATLQDDATLTDLAYGVSPSWNLTGQTIALVR